MQRKFDDKIQAFKARILSALDNKSRELLGDDVIHDLAALGAYLNEEVIVPHLRILNYELAKVLSEKGLLINEDDKQSIKKSHHDYYTSQYKVLTDFIEKWAKENGFNQGGEVVAIQKDDQGNNVRSLIKLPDHSPTVVGELTSLHFRSILLSLAYIFKDVGAGAAHGEFTHFLALYVLVQENKYSPFLESQNSVLDLYKLLGSTKTSAHGIILWDYIFDGSTNDFNSPVYFHQFVRDRKDKFPILAEILEGRFNKRSMPHEKDHYHQKKLAEKTFQLHGLFFKNIIGADDAKKTPNPDHILFELHYDETLAKIYPKPQIPIELPLIDQLIMLFDAIRYHESNETNLAIAHIQNQLIKYKDNHQSDRRSLVSILNAQSYILANDHSKDKNSNRILFLVNEAKKMLIDDEKKFIAQEKNKPTPPPK